MTCISPPELSEPQLLMYLDGDGADEINSHLKQCSYCRNQADQLAHLQGRLISRLYRFNCPSSLELGEFHLRMLPASRVLVIAQHLRECPHCRQEIAHLRVFLSEPIPQTSVLEQLKILTAKLISGRGGMDQESGQSAMMPAYTGLRGGEDEEPFIYQADNVRIIIEVQDDVEQMGFKTLLGLVTGLESNEFTIQVSQGDQVIATTSVDEIGNFIISHLAPGHYKLILTGPNMEIHVQSLPV